MGRARRIPSWCEVTHYKVGQVLWHGTSHQQGFPMLRGPAWVSDSHAVASTFAGFFYSMRKEWVGPPRVLKFEVAQPFSLPTLHARDRVPFEAWAARLVYGGRGFDPDSGSDMDREGIAHVAGEVCDAGFHGWRITDNYEPGDDIMLCFPERLLRRVQAGQRLWPHEP